MVSYKKDVWRCSLKNTKGILMKQIKLFFLTMMFFSVTSAFANTIVIHSSKSNMQETGNWKLEKKLNPLYFRFGQNKSLTIHVNNTVASGLSADPVYVYCYANTGTRNNLIKPGATLTCLFDYDDTIMIEIAPNDFKNGSAGTYEFNTAKY